MTTEAAEEMVLVSKRDLDDLLEACVEGGWTSGDPLCQGPTLKDATNVIRQFWDFREEVWNGVAEENGWVSEEAMKLGAP